MLPGNCRSDVGKAKATSDDISQITLVLLRYLKVPPKQSFHWTTGCVQLSCLPFMLTY